MIEHQKETEFAQCAFITRRQLARRWALSAETLKRYEERGLLRVTKFAPRCVRYAVAHVKEIEAQGSREK